MILSKLQGKLQSQYDLDIPYDVTRFVSHDIEVAKNLAQKVEYDEEHVQEIDIEVVFVRQDADSMEFLLYLDAEIVQNYNHYQLIPEVDENRRVTLPLPYVDEVCALVEGVSHAVCLLWHAHNDRQIRPIDLELQAEVDKFVVLLDERKSKPEYKKLHKQLFTQFSLTQARGSEVYERYRTANELAARYCHWLAETFVNSANQTGLDQELARFYRLSGQAKFDHIRRLH